MGPNKMIRSVCHPQGRHELREDRSDFRDDIRDADDHGDVRDTKHDYRRERHEDIQD